jgi:hypothetical protein
VEPSSKSSKLEKEGKLLRKMQLDYTENGNATDIVVDLTKTGASNSVNQMKTPLKPVRGSCKWYRIGNKKFDRIYFLSIVILCREYRNGAGHVIILIQFVFSVIEQTFSLYRS